MRGQQKISLNIGKDTERILKEFTAFEKDVYRAAAEIPLGEVRTYKWIAERIGRPKAVRAVGQALKKNPLPLLIPCHRVVSCSGLGGYALGREMKTKLLEFEKALKSSIL